MAEVGAPAAPAARWPTSVVEIGVLAVSWWSWLAVVEVEASAALAARWPAVMVEVVTIGLVLQATMGDILIVWILLS